MEDGAATAVAWTVGAGMTAAMAMAPGAGAAWTVAANPEMILELARRRCGPSRWGTP
jgi:hypothetical protein